MTGAHVAVIGSGPAGAACAHALTSMGHRVDLLDIGIEPEAGVRSLMRRDARVDRAAFLASVFAGRRRNLKRSTLPAKLPFGSTYAYRETPGAGVEVGPGTMLVTSGARGGLSAAWGANLSLIARRDMGAWPFGPERLVDAVARLRQFVDVSAERDAIDELYDEPLADAPAFALSRQGQAVLSRIRRHERDLVRDGLYCGRSKLAIGRRYATGAFDCAGCGLCMHGCPYDAIFNAANVVEDLRRRPGFTYVPGVMVQRFRQTEGGVELHARDLGRGVATVRAYDRVFIGAGVLGTTALVARSLGWLDRPFAIKDSTKYLFPYLTRAAVPGATREQANSLSQVFLQGVALASTDRVVHGQLYGYNDLLTEPVRAALGPLGGLAVRGGAPLLNRLMIGMVYLHSDDSGHLEFTVDPREDAPRLGRVVGKSVARSDVVMREYLGRLTRHRARLGGRPVPALASKNLPGNSLHFGGSIPMRRSPGPYESDELGRPHGCDRVHLVDLSVFPSIPGTPTAFVMMANAIRIAREVMA